MDSNSYLKHKPVLLKKLVEIINPKKGDIIIDCTSGLGGHASEIIPIIGLEGKYICIDQDKSSLDQCKNILSEKFPDNQIIYYNINFSDIDKIGNFLEEADIIISDLGISSFQLDNEDRGFSFKNNGPLDMRMDKKNDITAKEIVNTYSQRDLLKILLEYGEIQYQYAKKISSLISTRRENKEINTTYELALIVNDALPSFIKGGKIQTLVFQAIRIEVNKELENIKILTEKLFEKAKIGAKIGIITFHSLEDRIIKRFFKHWSNVCVCDKKNPICVCKNQNKKRFQIINKEIITPDEEELALNPRARSAKLRAVKVISL